MKSRSVLALFAVTAFVIGLPFTVLHLIARPDDSPITPFQHFVAALANYFGPWGVAIVSWVDFPNSGLRAFSWSLAIGLTLLGAAIVLVASRVNRRPLQISLTVVWGLFSLVWFAVGLRQIADGLL
ncbi:MAG: hypothetical protein AB1813_12720 [Verrucomicrobiota bacterium]